ncbi:AAA family ATPase [Agrobacterium tumefaciens]|uniref:AAA family ATPase n=1 Tax=Agrobacterium tumefaciens TaxID=358 RepID=UPI00046E7327
MPISTKNTKIHSSVKHYALYRTFERALDQCRHFKLGGPGIIGLVVPAGTAAVDYKSSAVAFLYEGVEREEWDHLGFACIDLTDKPQRIKDEFDDKCGKRQRAILITETTSLPPVVTVAVDTFIDLEPINEDDLREACSQVLKLRMSAKQARQLLTFPPDLMFAALSRNITATNAIFRLKSVPTDVAEATPIRESPRRLEDLHGYGSAKEWGLQLSGDLEAWRSGRLKWSDVDRGLLLAGPPGVGKTIFARALAETCGVNFVATSVSQWQAKGHLGDLLKAMRADFASAVDKAPSIILIDELDSIGDRSKFTGEYASYSVQVVNALLEALDGTSKRDGLVVIGATNFPERIDPAILRPGRLDRHVVIGLPGVADRVAIVKQMLGEHVVEGLDALGPPTEAMSGADLDRMVHDAKKRARRGNRQVILADFMLQLPDLIKIDGAYRHAISIHEAGHAVVGRTLGHGVFRGVKVAARINPRIEVQSAGGASFEFPVVEFRDEQRCRDEICLRLAGIAAERLVLGSHGDGCGVGPTSDLAIATDVALTMETKSAMGDQLYQFGRETAWDQYGHQSVPWLFDRVNNILREEMARATDIVAAKRPLLIAVANELEEIGSVSPERFVEIRDQVDADAFLTAITRVPDDQENLGTSGNAKPRSIAGEVRR